MAEPTKGLCSVIIPCYGMGHLIGAALDSLTHQTCRNWELIVVDDCGPDDGAREAVATFADANPGNRVRFIRHDVNRGVSQARKTAILEAQGEYVAFLDADDSFLPTKLEACTRILQQHPSVMLVHSAVTSIADDKLLAVKMEKAFEPFPSERKYRLQEQSWHLKANHINNSTVVCRRSAIAVHDFPDQLIFQAEDWFLWLAVAEHGEFYYLPDKLTRYVTHPAAFTSRVFARPGAVELALLEVLSSIYFRTATVPKSEVAEKMLFQLNELVQRRASLAGVDQAQAVRHFYRAFFFAAAGHVLRHVTAMGFKALGLSVAAQRVSGFVRTMALKARRD